MSDGQPKDALIVVDVQRGFEEPFWGKRNNPGCEENIAKLIGAWRSKGDPIVFVRHDSLEPDSPLAPGSKGNDFKDVISGQPDLLVRKNVHSAFYGNPDLHAWLQERGIDRVTICGITTNHCCETTVRMGADLGYGVRFVLDATHTFDMTAPDGSVVSAETLTSATAAGLHEEFAQVVSTREIA